MPPSPGCFNEAPAIPPGRARCPANNRRGASASMRPRRFRRGEVYIIAPECQYLFAASMRPRRFRRGERKSRPSRRSRSRRGFNEAPAIPPGRGRKTIAKRLRRKCFNEAPAIPPGRARSNLQSRRQLRSSFNEAPAIPPGRGERSQPDEAWDSRFNEAPAIPPGRDSPYTTTRIRCAALQ